MYFISKNTARKIKIISTAILLLTALVWVVNRTAGFMTLEGIPWPWAVAILVELLTVHLFISGKQGSKIGRCLALIFIMYSSWNIVGPDLLNLVESHSRRDFTSKEVASKQVNVESLQKNLVKIDSDINGLKNEIEALKKDQEQKTKVGTYAYNLLRNDINRTKKRLQETTNLFMAETLVLRSAQSELAEVQLKFDPVASHYTQIFREVSKIFLSLLIFYASLFLSHSLVDMFGIAKVPHAGGRPLLVKNIDFGQSNRSKSAISSDKVHGKRPARKKIYAQVKT